MGKSSKLVSSSAAVPHTTTVKAYDADENIVYRFDVAPDELSYATMSTVSESTGDSDTKDVTVRALTMRILKETHRLKQKTRQVRSRRMALELPSNYSWYDNLPGWRTITTQTQQQQQSRSHRGHRDRKKGVFADNNNAMTMIPNTWSYSHKKNGKRLSWSSPFGTIPGETVSIDDRNTTMKATRDYKHKQLQRRRMGSLRAAF